MAFNDLVGEIYEAALDETRWPGVIEKLCVLAGADWGAIIFHDRLSRQRNRYWPYGVKVAAVQVYIDQFIDIDMNDARHHLLAAPEAEVFSFHWDRVEFARDIPYAEKENQGQNELAALIDEYSNNVSRMAAKLLSTQNLFSVVALSRTGKNNPENFNHEESSRLQALTPHVARACRIYHQLSAVRGQNEKLLQTLKCISHGVLLLDNDLRVIYANEEGGRIVERHPALTVGRYGKLKASRSDENHALQKMLDELLQNCFFVSDRNTPTLALHCDTSLHPLKLTAVPLLASGLDPQLVSEGICIAVFVTDVERGIAVPEKYLQQTYNLTPAECNVAFALVNGASIHEISQQRSVSESTVRWQVKCLLQKTVTPTQAELVRLLMSVSLDSSMPI